MSSRRSIGSIKGAKVRRVRWLRGCTHTTEVTGDIEVTVDLEELVRTLGEKALRNSTGRARAMSGIIEARAYNRKEVS